MANIKIAKTKIGTPSSNLGSGLNLCKGLALFPPFPAIPLGWISKGGGDLRLNQSFNLIAARASAGGSFGLHVGLCGPSYAIQFNAEGEVENGTLTLAIEDDEAMGGIYLGAGMQANFELKAEIYRLYWYWGPRGEWSAALNVELGVGIDVLKAAADILEAVVGIEGIFGTVVETAVDTPLAMVGEAGDEYASKFGKIEMNCVFTVPVNLWSVIVLAAYGTVEVPYINVASAAVIAIEKVLDVTLSSIGFGPTIGLSVPVGIQIRDVSLDSVKFNRKSVSSEGKWVGELADKSSVVAAEPKEITFTMAHTAGFDLRVGLYAELQLLELFHVGASADMGILGLFNIQPRTGEFTHTLRNNIGSASPAADCGCSAASGVGLVDVQFI